MWIGPVIKPSLSNLDPVLQREFDTEFGQITENKKLPLRLLRSEMVIETGGEQQDFEIVEEDFPSSPQPEQPTEKLDPYDLAEPYDVLSKISPEQFKALSSPKWKDRKESLEKILELSDKIKLAEGSYGELVGVLGSKVLDTNILVATLSANIIEKLASGLRSNFAQYQDLVTKQLFERLKEKKQSVVVAIQNALLAIFKSTEMQISKFIPDLTFAISHKNPQIKSEALKFFTSSIKLITSRPPKSQIKEFVDLVKPCENDSTPTVREACFEFLGTLMKITGESVLLPFIESIEKPKEAKIRDFFDKAVVSVSTAPAARVANPSLTSTRSNPAQNSNRDRIEQRLSKQRLETHSSNLKAEKQPLGQNRIEPKINNSVSKPANKMPSVNRLTSKPPNLSNETSNIKNDRSHRPTVKVSTAASESLGPENMSKPLDSKYSNKPADDTPVYRYSSSDDLDGAIASIIPSEILDMLQSSLWKDRLNGIKMLTEHLTSMDDFNSGLEPELVIRQLAKKPGWKESNFQVNMNVYNLIKTMSEECSRFNSGAAALAIPYLVDKLGDIKLKEPAANTLIAIAERLGLRFVLLFSVDSMSKQKSPKVLSDSLVWLNQVLLDFGSARLSLRPLIQFVINTGLQSNNAQVRSKSVTVMGTLRRFVGPSIKGLIGEINSQLMQLLEAEFEKVGNEPPPEPTRSQPAPVSATKSGSKSNNEQANRNNVSSTNEMEELFPRVDLSQKMNANIIKKLSDANWKLRKEALDFISEQLIASNKRIEPTLSNDFVTALKNRLNDTNKNLVLITLNIFSIMAESLGEYFEKYIRIICLPTLQTLSDKKPNIRAAAVKALDSYYQGSVVLADIIFSFVPAALAHDSPELRKDLLIWVNKVLSEVEDRSESDLNSTLPNLSGMLKAMLICLQDKNGEVRKNATYITSYVIKAIGFGDVRAQVLLQLKGASLQSVMSIIETLQPTQKTFEHKINSPEKLLTAADLLHKVKPSQSSEIKRGSQVFDSSGSKLLQNSTASSTQKATLPSQSDSFTSQSRSDAKSSENVQQKPFNGMQRRPMTVRKRVVSTYQIRAESPKSRPISQMSSLSVNTSSNPESPESSREFYKNSSPAETISAPIVQSDPKYKEIRFKKETSSLNSIKWAFQDAPRQDLINYLHEQMSFSFSPDLTSQLFSTGHYRDRNYLAGIATLVDFISVSNSYAEKYGLSFEEFQNRIISNSDLIFKYVSIRIYDTQPTLALKSIDLLEHLVKFLGNSQGKIGEYETQLFVPHMIVRLGDPKESIRARIRQLLVSDIATLSHPSKIIMNAIDFGIKNPKNARVRQEAIDLVSTVLTKYADSYGFANICAAPGKVCPVIGQSIQDRDASVRTAAMNCLVTFSGFLKNGRQEMLKLVGPMPDKERGMLDEKLKRSDIGLKPSIVPTVNKQSMSPSGVQFKRGSIAPSSRLRPLSLLPQQQQKTPLSVRSRINSVSPYASSIKGPSSLDSPTVSKIKDDGTPSKDFLFARSGNRVSPLSDLPSSSSFNPDILPKFSTRELQDIVSSSISSEKPTITLIENDFQDFSVSNRDYLGNLLIEISNRSAIESQNLLEKLQDYIGGFINRTNLDEHALISKSSRAVILTLCSKIDSYIELKNGENYQMAELLNPIMITILSIIELFLSDVKWAQSLELDPLSVLFTSCINFMVYLKPEEDFYVKNLNTILSYFMRNCNLVDSAVAMISYFAEISITPIKLPLNSESKTHKLKVGVTMKFLRKLEKRIVYDISDYIEAFQYNNSVAELVSSQSINPGVILAAIENFFLSIPESEWNNRKEGVCILSDEPMKAVNSLLSSIISITKEDSWLFMGDPIILFFDRGRYDIDISDFTLGSSDQLEHVSGDMRELINKLLHNSVVSRYIFEYVKGYPTQKQWEFVCEYIKSKSYNAPLNSVKNVVSGTSDTNYVVNVSSSYLGTNASDTRISDYSETRSPELISEFSNSLNIKSQNNQRTIGNDNLRGGFSNDRSQLSSYLDASRNSSPFSEQNKFGSIYPIDADPFKTATIDLDTKKQKSRIFDVDRFPLGTKLRQESRFEKSVSFEKEKSSFSLSSNIQNTTARSMGESPISSDKNANFASRSSILTFDENLKRLKARLDKMRKERLG
ncbi:hypothetical protein BB560_003480 [Smittium megazygosporum]|uniref:VHS domain-containing protein n=1 Tax=Smittium megazygosporum TaxID=133381 RepID=A0A2T9ZC15_9FUNG|nr:hypothetical protein BB560_003480 [Smittium megazygosporum]